MRKVDNPLATMESFNRQFQVGKKEREAVEIVAGGKFWA